MAVGKNLTKILSDEICTDLLLLWTSLWLVIIAFGLWANGLIIRTFLRIGLTDSVTISFFCLALSDFCHLFLPLGNIGIFIAMYMEAKYSYIFEVQPLLVWLYPISMTAIFNNLTSYITTFLAVQRCLCIVKPLKFKGMFTKRFTWYLLTFLLLFSAVPTVTSLSLYKFIAIFDTSTNTTKYVPYINKAFNEGIFYVQLIYFLVINFSSQGLIFVSMLIMISGLKASVRFRKHVTMTSKGDTQRNADQFKPDGARQISKERLAIVQVALLCAIYLVSTTPKLGVAVVTQLDFPGFTFGGFYQNIFFVTVNIRLTFDNINSAVNFLVYYKYNTKFRKLCFASKNKNEYSK